ncbi:hypothetical protein [Arthrobacter sp. U41]|uniref:hypothetical protein n=1 Tax=Arthrobacter sp. U41 TaxID=1849032 RepID=UPI0008594A55|nr:hypothetical protein [Arthrobacter sp. U41]AOT02283.1 hypothetical protein ASPU41_01915 [Arthrobacter sp. U41]
MEAQGYLDCQNILESLGKRNKARLEAACQVLLDTGQGPGTYSTIKRIMATIDSDTKKPRTVTPAAATRKPAAGADPGAGLGAAGPRCTCARPSTTGAAAREARADVHQRGP